MQATLGALQEFLADETAQGRIYLPTDDSILRAFSQPMSRVKVLIVGQDPYPTRSHPTGLAFSVAPEVRPLPRTLQNIFKEYVSDTGFPAPSSGDLTPWFNNGVLLLNRVLTVAEGEPGSHRNRGWESVTECALKALGAHNENLVSILWGRDASALAPLFPAASVISSPHPSPLSASRGFFGTRPFTRANALLIDRGVEPVNWRLP